MQLWSLKRLNKIKMLFAKVKSIFVLLLAILFEGISVGITVDSVKQNICYERRKILFFACVFIDNKAQILYNNKEEREHFGIWYFPL